MENTISCRPQSQMHINKDTGLLPDTIMTEAAETKMLLFIVRI